MIPIFISYSLLSSDISPLSHNHVVYQLFHHRYLHCHRQYGFTINSPESSLHGPVIDKDPSVVRILTKARSPIKNALRAVTIFVDTRNDCVRDEGTCSYAYINGYLPRVRRCYGFGLSAQKRKVIVIDINTQDNENARHIVHSSIVW